SISDIENLQIPTGDGGTVALKNIATVTRKIKEVKNSTRLNQEESVGIQIFKQSDASVVAVGDAVNKDIEKLRKDFPDYRIFIANDQSKYVHQSLNNTQMSIFEGIATTALALLFFLKEWRSMLTVLIAIPTSLIASLFAMYFAGFTFNMMSLMGMALCIGILVDDSIVVLENIHRHRGLGKAPKIAALEGRMEIGTAALAITLCDVVVFMPIAFMGGMVGQFFRQFGLTVVIATLFSLFVSFTLTPMLASRLYKNGGEKKKEWAVWQKIDKFGGWFKSRYETALLWSLENPKKVVAAALVLLTASLSLIPLKLVGAEFMPKTDEGVFSVTVELPVGTPFARADEAAVKVEKYLMQIPEVDNIQSRVGNNQGSVNVRLKDKKSRARTIWQITDEVRQWSKAQFPPGTVRVSESSMTVAGMPGGGPGGGGSVQIEVLGPDNDKLVEISQEVMGILNQTAGAKDVNTNWRLGQPEIQTTVNRERARYYNASLADITRALQAGVSGTTAGEFVDQGKDIDINVRFKDGDQIKPAELKTVPVYTGGQTIALGNLVDFKEGVGPRTIRRVDKQRAITVTCNLTDRALQDFISEVEQKVRSRGFDPLYTVRFAGQAQSMADTFNEMIAALLLAITLVYMVLVVLYESFLTPFIRMFSLPLGFIGALVALAVTRNNLNLFSMMGIIMMDGLVAKNGTLLLDYTLTLIDRGKTVREAIIEAGKTRLRPIMMTSITMICGMLPTALALSEGSENRVGMAWVLIGGLITSTFFTLVIIPIIFLTLNRWKERLAARFSIKTTRPGRNEREA
ncbi:MAG: efflux RND transporter permease subunit, partial [Firmicutes bacterium]|nr:efflux RND transporter permease subunit [Bacillota bacterium]